jgi:hypothetical protein
MTPYSLNPAGRDGTLAQFVSIERHSRGIYARLACPMIGQREAPIISGEISEAIANSHLPRGGSLVVEWSELVERYGRRSDDPSKTEIPNLMTRPAA